MKAPKAAGVAVVLLLLSGCSGSPGSPPTQPAYDNPSGVASPSKSKRIMGPGKYTFTSKEGGKGVLQVPAPPDPQLEELRNLAQAEPVAYITPAVDNRDGTLGINMYRINIYTPEGQEMRYTGTTAYLDQVIQPKLPKDNAASSKFTSYYNAHLDDAEPLQVKDFVMVGPPVPDKITGITVYPTGIFNPVQAEPAG